MWKQVKPELVKKFAEIEPVVKSLKRDFIIDEEIPEALINQLIASSEFKDLGFFQIKSAFKKSLIQCFAYLMLNMLLASEACISAPSDWPKLLKN